MRCRRSGMIVEYVCSSLAWWPAARKDAGDRGRDAETPARDLDRPATSCRVRELGSVRGLACEGRILRFGRSCHAAGAEPESPEGRSEAEELPQQLYTGS